MFQVLLKAPEKLLDLSSVRLKLLVSKLSRSEIDFSLYHVCAKLVNEWTNLRKEVVFQFVYQCYVIRAEQSSINARLILQDELEELTANRILYLCALPYLHARNDARLELPGVCCIEIAAIEGVDNLPFRLNLCHVAHGEE